VAGSLREFFLITFRDVKEQPIRELGFEFIDRFIRRNKVIFSSLKHESFEIVDKIKEIDYKTEDTDAIHLANCIQDKGNVFVTFDEKLVGNIRLEKAFNIRIIHPERL
jgi:predicted nucleic acid-binding protein